MFSPVTFSPVKESLRKYHQSKAMLFLIRNCIQKKIQLQKKKSRRKFQKKNIFEKWKFFERKKSTQILKFSLKISTFRKFFGKFSEIFTLKKNCIEQNFFLKLKIFLDTASIQKKHIFRLVWFVERFRHSLAGFEAFQKI